MNLKTLRTGLSAIALAACASLTHAVPTLQLGILGGTYDAATQTIIASGSPFTLYAFLDGDATAAQLADNYYISAALVPKTGPTGANLGSFTFDGSTVNVTADMTYGVPPLETVASQMGDDPGDLPDHGIFDTFFKQFAFTFSANATASFGSGAGANNTQDFPALTGLQTFNDGSGSLYYASFVVNVDNLAAGYAIHFDLYNSDVEACTQGNSPNCVIGDIDIDDFAPFSHDAQSGSSSSSSSSSSGAPEPGSSGGLALMGLGLLALGFKARRRTH